MPRGVDDHGERRRGRRPRARRAPAWRMRPQRSQSATTSSTVVLGPGGALLGGRRAGADDADPHAGALELHLHGAGQALEPVLGRRRRRPCRARGTRTTSEVTNTMSPRRRSTIAGPRRRTRRWAPSRLTCTWRAKSSGSASSGGGGQHVAGVATRATSIGPERGLGRRRRRRRSSASSVRSSGRRDGLAAVGPDLGRGLLAAARRRRAPSTTGWPAAASASAVAAPMPEDAPVTTAGAAVGVRRRTAASAGRHRGGEGGEAADVDASARGGCRRGRCRSRRRGAPAPRGTTRASSRASDAPRQKWRPKPKLAICWLARRAGRGRSGRGRRRRARRGWPSRRAAAPGRRRGSRVPCSSTSSVVTRASIWLDVS